MMLHRILPLSPSFEAPPMPYYPLVELNDIAESIEEATGCTPFEAQQAAQAVQVVVNQHRGAGSPIERLRALQERYDTLMAALEKWSGSLPEPRRQEDWDLEVAAGIYFPLTPEDE